MPIKVDDPRDIQGSVEDRFNQLNQAEQTPGSDYANAGIDQAEAFANDPNNATDAVRDREQAGAGSDANWQTNINNAPSADKSSSGIRSRMSAAAKKGGPFGIILAIMLGGAGFVSFFGGPGLLIVNLAEIMTNKFDYQVSTLDTRHKLIIQSKLSATTDGCSKLSFRCKYSTFSDKEISNFEKSGIKANGTEKTITGRNKIKSFTFNGEEITAKNFASTLKANPSFSNAMHGAYNMKFLSKTDKIWGMIEKKFKFSKAAPFDENSTDDERQKKIKETSEKGASKIKTSATSCDDKCTDEQKQAAQDSQDAKAQADEITQLGEGEDSKASQALDEIKTGGATKLGLNLVKITGTADTVCMVAGWVNIISATAKTVRLAQLIRYGMIFLTTASMIKAGTATPGDVAFLGTIITKVVKDQAGNLSKSGTESFGYRYAAFGDKGIDTNASKAVVGGSFGGTIESSVDKIYSFVGGKSNVKSVCHGLANPFVQAGSIGLGIAGFFLGASEAKTVVLLGLQAVVSFVAPFLAAYLGELLAGELIKSSTFGEESVNFITSGAGGMLGQVANYGGGSVMSPDQAVAFLDQQREVAASYANYERSVYSPLDASNPNTFMGSMFTAFAPYLYSNDTPMAAIHNLGSIIISSAKNLLLPSTASAETASSLASECHDTQYEDLNLAADPFCNLIIGIPPKYTGVDTLQVQQEMQDAQLVDESGQPKTGGTIADTGMSYPDFIKQCMQRDQPYGLEDVSTDESEKCVIDSQAKANAYIHYVDLRIGDMEDADPGAATGTAATGVGGSSANSSAASTDQLPDYCTNGSLPANDLGQAVCKAYKYNNYGYLWGGGHDGTAADFVSKFNAGGFSEGTQILDCSGLVRMSIFEATGVDIGGMSTGDFPGSSNLVEVPKDQAKPGDIVWRNGHVELVVSNDSANQKWYTFGAHTDEAPINEQIGPSSYTYASMEKVYRLKR